MGKYIYGIIEEGKAKTLFSLSEKPVYTIPFGKLSAVIKDADIAILEGSAQELLSHNQILLQLMDSYTVIPMAFGMIASEERDIIDLLTHAYQSFEEAIRRLRGKVEFNLEVRWDEREFLKLIASEHSQIQDLRRGLASAGGSLTLEEKIELGKMTSEALQRKKEEIIESIYHALKKVSLSNGELPSTKDSSVLFHAAFLVIQQDGGEFEKTLNLLDEKFNRHLRFSLTGPLPPYSFTGIKINIVTREDINQAQRTLKISDKLSPGKLKKAYWNLSKQHHPDSAKNVKTSNEEFKKIARAYEILDSFCKNYDYNLQGEIPQRVILVNSSDAWETRYGRS